MNTALTKPVTNKEVKEAVFSIKSASAPRLDGTTGFFFKNYWDILEENSHGKLKVSSTRESCQRIGITHKIFFIPNIENPTMMKELRPISLCSVLYKIVSNTMVNRLKPFLPQIISPTQPAFVSERLISDNILIAYELVHRLKTHAHISENFMILKMDMSKAYDRVECSFLQSLLQAM